jgi:hypothetical protein
MRPAVLFPILLMLAACSGPGPAASPAERTEARFLEHGVADRIEIQALNRLPLRTATLIGPGGMEARADDIVVAPAASLGERKLLGSAPLSGGRFGVAAIPPSPAALGGAPQASVEVLLMLSTGSLTLPDRVAYRRDWRRYRIKLRFGDPPGAVERQGIAAPRPPGG